MPKENNNDSIDYVNFDDLFLEFEERGKSPTNTSIKHNVSNKYTNGKNLSLFLHNGYRKQLDDQSRSMIVTEGPITFNLTHYSFYILPQDTTNNNTMLYVGIIIVIVAIISLITIVVIRSINKA